MQDWPEVAVQATPATAEQMEAWLFAAGALSVTYLDESGEPILEPAPGEIRLWDQITLTGLFMQGRSAEELHTALQLAAAGENLDVPGYTLQRLPDEFWERSWMRDFKPMQFGPRLWICPSHCTSIENAVNVMLDPGLAFGTGTHPTTALCLQWLGRNTADTEQPMSTLCVLDYGCGSGVLGIAAALLGAREVWAVDIDQQAIDATRRNADANGMSQKMTVGNPLIVKHLLADVILANILYQPLLALADLFAAAVRPGGNLVLSGLLQDQIEPLCLRYNACFIFEPTITQQGWALLSATRRFDC